MSEAEKRNEADRGVGEQLHATIESVKTFVSTYSQVLRPAPPPASPSDAPKPTSFEPPSGDR